MQVVVCDGNKEKRTISLESFGKDVISFGRHPESDIVLSSSAVSRVHGCFYLENGLWHVKDLESTNGIFINGNRVDEKCLSDGIEIVITNNKEVNGTVRITLKEEKYVTENTNSVTKNSNKKRLTGIIAISIAFVAILCVIVWGIISKSDDKKDKHTEESDNVTELELSTDDAYVDTEEATEEVAEDTTEETEATTEEETEETTEETEATTEEMTTEETTEEITTEIDKVALCALNPDILGVNLYDNYNPETEYSEVTMAQVADMVFYDEMSYAEFVSVIEGSAFECSGYIGNPDIILTPNQGMELVVSINGEEVFEAGIFNMGDESVRFKECTLTRINIIEGTSWTWYNSYGIGAYGENVPDYFTFIDTLNSYGIEYDERTADDGNIEVKLMKIKPEGIYYAVCSFVFDRYEGECLYTSWDMGVRLVPEIGTADPY